MGIYTEQVVWKKACTCTHLLKSVSSSSCRCSCTQTTLRICCNQIAQTALRELSVVHETSVCSVVWKQNPACLHKEAQTAASPYRLDKLFVRRKQHGQCFEISTGGAVLNSIRYLYSRSVMEQRDVPLLSCSFSLMEVSTAGRWIHKVILDDAVNAEDLI